MAEPAGTPRSRALAAALRRELEVFPRSIREVARTLDLSHTTISQWQNGRRVPEPEDVAALLAVIGVTGKRRAEILSLARSSAEPNWLAVPAPGLTGGLPALIECERTASGIVDWTPLLVPGLLQTTDYARAILGCDERFPADVIEARVRQRNDRKSVLTNRRLIQLRFTAFIGEQSLRQVIGGRPAMIEQLRQLLVATERPTITVQVVRAGEGWHPALSGPFILFDFDRAPSIVHLEHHHSTAFLYNTDQVAAYRMAAETLSRVALSPKDSAAFIAEVMNEMEQRE